MAEVLGKLGSRHVMVVHAEDGLDEISLSSPTAVAELRDGNVIVYTVRPEDFGCKRCDIQQLITNDAGHSLELLRAALTGEHAAACDIVALNAGAALYVSGLADNLASGVTRAKAVIADGSATARLNQLIEFTNKL
jgi:anthranilate phosphoribosyltransferase